MTDRVKNMLLIVLSITALALGGSALAGAASGGSGSNGNGSGNNSSPARPQFGGPGQAGVPPQRPDETLLTGDTAAKVQCGRACEGERRHGRTGRDRRGRQCRVRGPHDPAAMGRGSPCT